MPRQSATPLSPVNCEVEDEPPFFDTVDVLIHHGISAADVLKLKHNSIHTVARVRMTHRKTLQNIKGLTKAKVKLITDAANSRIGPSFISAVAVARQRKSVLFITTGSQAVDAILGGGIESQSLTEVYGEFRTGKTQLCHTLCITAQLPVDMGGAHGKVAYIDTEGTFRPDRIRSIANRFGLDGNRALENILYARAWNTEQQMDIVNELSSLLASDKHFRLLIVDSIMACFRADYSGRGQMTTRQQKLAEMLSKLKKLAEEYNIAVLLTNQVQSDSGSNMLFVGGGVMKPIGGHVLAHASVTRISIKKGPADERLVDLVESPHCPETRASFILGDGGWLDV